MTETITLPLWQFLCLLAFAAITFASHFLFPSVRWFFRRRMERVVARLNERLERPIEPFKLARRHDTIQKLIYDTEVSKAISDYARDHAVPENVAFQQARAYAREIVPRFSATAYFGVAIRVAKWLSRSLYQVRIEHLDRDELRGIDPEATVIYVMNHRSNMDYVLVTWLAAERTAMSYAVGEWARVWPLSLLIQAMGAYFIRRKGHDDLYRRVLARYVSLATDAGVTQAVFPEGGLSLTGGLAPPKHGILKYITEGRNTGGRDVVFVPVAINYDRVFEDRLLVAASRSGQRRFPARIGVVTRFALRQMWQKLTRRYEYHGCASVSFGSPLVLSEFRERHDTSALDALSAELMRRIGAEVPVLPVALISHVMLETPDLPEVSTAQLNARIGALTDRLQHARLSLPDDEREAIVQRSIGMMTRRNMINETKNGYVINDRDLLGYYAASIAHLFADAVKS